MEKSVKIMLTPIHSINSTTSHASKQPTGFNQKHFCALGRSIHSCLATGSITGINNHIIIIIFRNNESCQHSNDQDSKHPNYPTLYTIHHKLHTARQVLVNQQLFHSNKVHRLSRHRVNNLSFSMTPNHLFIPTIFLFVF